MGNSCFNLEPLENMASIHDSERVPVKRSVRKPGPYPYYGASGITDYVHNYLFDGDYVLLAEDGDNLRSRSTPIAFMARGQFWVNNHAHVLKGKNGNNTDFICYALQIADVSSYISGSTRPKITQKDMRKIPLFCPSVETQKSIAHVLGSLDDKIELNRQMNATLESMAQALFKSWFVDFDPVIDNALAAGNPIPEPFQARAKNRHKSAGQRIWTPDEGARRASTRDGASQLLGDKRKPLPEAIQQQFPSSFVFTEEVGWIPERWSFKPLDEIANYQNGLALQNFRPNNENDFLPVVKIAQLKKGYADGEEKASPNIRPDCIIDDGDVVFSWSGSLMVDIWCGGKASLNQHLFKVTSDSFPRWFYYRYTIHHLEEFQRIAADKAVTMGHIKREHLRQALCTIPNLRLIEYCSNLPQDLLNRVIHCRLECRHLEHLRDTLLPKLLSGQLRIPDAEKLMAEVL